MKHKIQALQQWADMIEPGDIRTREDRELNWLNSIFWNKRLPGGQECGIYELLSEWGRVLDADGKPLDLFRVDIAQAAIGVSFCLPTVLEYRFENWLIRNGLPQHKKVSTDDYFDHFYECHLCAFGDKDLLKARYLFCLTFDDIKVSEKQIVIVHPERHLVVQNFAF